MHQEQIRINKVDETLKQLRAANQRIRANHPDDEVHTDSAPKRRRVEGKSDLGYRSVIIDLIRCITLFVS